MVSADPYVVLGIPRNASDEDIKKAFRKLAAEYHPDKHNGSIEYANKFKAINEAYSKLNDPQSRAKIDSQNDQQVKFTSHIWEDILKPFYNVHNSNKKEDIFLIPGEDVTIETVISVKEAFVGTKKDFSYEALEQCKPCNSTGAVPGTRIMTCGSCGGAGFSHDPFLPLQRKCISCNGRKGKPLQPCLECKGNGIKRSLKKITISIPSGIEDGNALRISGKGKPGNPPGDLYIIIKITQEKGMERMGNDILFKYKVPWHLMVTGGSMEIESPLGQKLFLEIPQNSESDSTVKIEKGGFISSNGTGNALVKLTPILPKNCTKRQLRLISELVEDSSPQ